MPSLDVPAHERFEITQVARYHAFGETAGGFSVPEVNSAQSDRHFEFALPGATGAPGVIYYRTRRQGTPRFSVRINTARVTDYTFIAADEAERAWHEIIPAGTLQADANELVFAVYDNDGNEGPVVFGLYTADQTTIPIPIVTAPSE